MKSVELEPRLTAIPRAAQQSGIEFDPAVFADIQTEPQPGTFTASRIILAFGDILSLILPISILPALKGYPLRITPGAVALAVTWLVVAYIAGLYEPDISSRVERFFTPLSKTAAISSAAIVLIWLVAPATHLYIGPVGLTAALIAVAAWRIEFATLSPDYRRPKRVVVVGSSDASQTIIQFAASVPDIVSVIAVADLTDRGPLSTAPPSPVFLRQKDVPYLRSCQGLGFLVRDASVDEIVLADPGHLAPEDFAELLTCYQSGVPVRSLPEFYEGLSEQVPIELLDATWLQTFPLMRQTDRMYKLFKRGMDIVLAVIGLVVFLPLFPLLALLVKLSSPGPVFFRQRRVGLSGQAFTVVKFRTMTDDAGAWGQPVGHREDRAKVTRVGKWLRRMYLDETPQFALVLIGRMSIVGPRPKRVDQAMQLEARVPLWRAKYNVAPGLTGLGQVRFGYAASESEEMARLRHDLYYVRHRSVRLDLIILIKTLLRVLKLQGL